MGPSKLLRLRGTAPSCRNLGGWLGRLPAKFFFRGLVGFNCADFSVILYADVLDNMGVSKKGGVPNIPPILLQALM